MDPVSARFQHTDLGCPALEMVHFELGILFNTVTSDHKRRHYLTIQFGKLLQNLIAKSLN